MTYQRYTTEVPRQGAHRAFRRCLACTAFAYLALLSGPIWEGLLLAVMYVPVIAALWVLGSVTLVGAVMTLPARRTR